MNPEEIAQIKADAYADTIGLNIPVEDIRDICCELYMKRNYTKDISFKYYYKHAFNNILVNNKSILN